MRIRVDKKGSRDFIRPDFGYSHFLEKYNKDGVLDCSYHYQRLRCTICENCGVEIYGVWGYTSFNSFRYNGSGWGQEEYLYRARPQNVYTRERKISKEFEQLKQKYNEYKDECDAEYNELENLKACPICGAPITMRDKPLTRSVLGQIELSATVPYWSEEVGNKVFAQLISNPFDDVRKRDKLLKEQWLFELTCIYPNYINSTLTGKEYFTLMQDYAARNYGVDSAAGNRIKSDPALLKQYLLNAIRLKTNYSLSLKHLSTLYKMRQENNEKLKPLKYYPIYEMLQKMEADQILFDRAEAEYQETMIQLDKCREHTPEPIIIDAPQKPKPPVLGTPGFFNKKKVLAHNEELQRQYDSEMTEYDRKCAERKAEIEKQTRIAEEEYLAQISNAERNAENARAKMENLRVIPEKYTPNKPVEICPEKALQRILEREIEKAETNIRELRRAIDKLFCADVVYVKYIDIVALSTFYEYLVAGRCESLEGANGAYNLYEAESRSNLIITNLESIGKQLDRIERNQRTLYNQMQLMNRSLDDLNQKMENICVTINDICNSTKGIYSEVQDMNKYMENLSKNSSIIAYNTAATAYYSKMNAELTNALGFMVALK